MRLLLNTVFLILLSFPAFAAQEYVYAPEGCDFTMTFPSAPHSIKRCHEKFTDQCELMTGYTQVFGIDGTINFYVSCKPTENDQRENYTLDASRVALLARPGVESLEVYDIGYDQNDDAVMSALTGAGPTPNRKDVMIYIAQIWVGANSLLTIEGELIGHDIDEADALFAKILGSLRHKNWKADEPEPESTAPSTPENEPQ